MEELTNIKLYEIFQECKPSRFAKETDLNAVKEVVCNLLQIEESEKLQNDLQNMYKEYVSHMQSVRGKKSYERSVEVLVIMKKKDYTDKPKTPLLDLSDRQQRRRMNDFVSNTVVRAEKEGVTPTKLYAYGTVDRQADIGHF